MLVPRLKDEPHAYTRYFNAPMQVVDKSWNSFFNIFRLQASAGTIHGAAAGPGSTAAAGAQYKDKCVLEIVSVCTFVTYLIISDLIDTGGAPVSPVGLQQQPSKQEDDSQCAAQ